MDRLIVFDYFQRDPIVEGLLYGCGIHIRFESGLIICRTETRNQMRLAIAIARSLGRQDYLSVDLKTNFTYWHFISCVKVKYVGNWKYKETHVDGTRELLPEM